MKGEGRRIERRGLLAQEEKARDKQKLNKKTLFFLSLFSFVG
jgi:hypothetical protein